MRRVMAVEFLNPEMAAGLPDKFEFIPQQAASRRKRSAQMSWSVHSWSHRDASIVPGKPHINSHTGLSRLASMAVRLRSDGLRAIDHRLDEKNAGIGGKQSGRAKVEPRALHVQYPAAIGLQQLRHDNREIGQAVRLRAQMVQRPDCARCAEIKVPARPARNCRADEKPRGRVPRICRRRRREFH